MIKHKLKKEIENYRGHEKDIDNLKIKFKEVEKFLN